MTWLLTTPARLILIIISTVIIYGSVILLTRANGLRSFSKMSGFDFAMTIAVGSIIATTIMSERPSILEGVVALSALFACQRLVSWARIQRDASKLVDNEPRVLMANGELFQDALEETRVTKADVYAKLREANVTKLSEVRAVVLEATGDISVLHGRELDAELLSGVLGRERIAEA